MGQPDRSEGVVLRRLMEVDGYALDVEDNEPRIRDLDLGELLGYGRPRKIRELIERSLADLPGIQQRPAVGRYEIRPGVEHSQPRTEYRLTAAEALFVAARSETPAGAAVLKRLIDVFMLARQGLLAEAQAAAGSPALSTEQIVLLASRVAAETALAVVAGRTPPRRGTRVLPGQGELFASLDVGRSSRLAALQERILGAVMVADPPVCTIGALRALVRARKADVIDAVNDLRARGRLARNGDGSFRAIQRVGSA